MATKSQTRFHIYVRKYARHYICKTHREMDTLYEQLKKAGENPIVHITRNPEAEAVPR